MTPDEYERTGQRLTLEYHAAAYADMEPHVATLKRLASEQLAIAELGLRAGVSTWALLDGLPDDGEMWSVEVNPELATVPRRVREDPRWTLIRGDDRDPRTQQQLPPVGLVLIDTSHEEGHTLTELYLADWLDADVIALHDWNLDGVRRAVEAFIDDRRGRWRIREVEVSRWGLCVLERVP